MSIRISWARDPALWAVKCLAELIDTAFDDFNESIVSII
jgi:hypothetical protein